MSPKDNLGVIINYHSHSYVNIIHSHVHINFMAIIVIHMFTAETARGHYIGLLFLYVLL